MVNKPIAINLLKKKGVGIIDRFISWALTIGRLLVIITETVALAAFLYRFSLDRHLVDLHDEIKIKQTVITATKDSEQSYRNLQDRLLLSSRLTQNENQTVALLQNIYSREKNDLQINTINIAEGHIKIEAVMHSISTLTNFVEALKAYPIINSVSLDRIEDRTSNGSISITMTAKFKK